MNCINGMYCTFKKQYVEYSTINECEHYEDKTRNLWGCCEQDACNLQEENHDYSVNGKSAFEKGFENFGITSLAIRLGDKVDRLTAFAKGNELQVTDENIEDTILDTAVYAVLGLVEIAYQKQNVKEG